MKRIGINFAAGAVFAFALPSTIVAVAAPPPAAAGMPSHTITVARGKPAIIASEKLRVELADVKDDRCPANARCIWAGHATVTLSVSQAGGKRKTVLIGTPAPADMNLPVDADYGAYHFSLVSLEPANEAGDKQASPSYRATVRVTRK